MMTYLQKHLALISILSIVLLSGCYFDSDSKSTVVWTPCEGAPSLDCASLKVPVDYSEPKGDKIDLALIRRKSTGSASKGVLLFNPGGPGASGVSVFRELATAAIYEIPSPILAAYDLVSFDPRGVGDSKVVDCSDEGFEEFVDPYPANEASLRQLYKQYSDVAKQCSKKYGDYLLHLGSINVVRDMEKIRRALGQYKLNFIGSSYGTRLGAYYLNEYPNRSGRIILDAGNDPAASLRDLLEGLLPPMEQNLLAILSKCSATGPDCTPEPLLDRMVARIDSISPPRSAREAQELYTLAGIANLVSRVPEAGAVAGPYLATYLNNFDVSALQLFLRLQEDSSDDSDSVDDDNPTLSRAVLCADDASRADVETLSSALYDFNQLSDIFAESQVSLLAQCSGWPDAIEPLVSFVTDKAPVSLVVGGATDAQAPLEGSKEMAQSVGGVFIESNHPGHTAVFNGRSQCVDDIATNFLLNGTVPTDRVCD